MPDTPTAPGNDAKRWKRPPGAEKRGFWLMLAAAIIRPTLNVFTKRTWHGQAKIPVKGPAIIVGNHYSHFDPMVMAHFVYKAGRSPRFLLKESIVKMPVVGRVIFNTGQIPVRRGTVDATKSLQEAIEALREGKAVIIYPEGTTSKQPDHWPMRGKTGVARLVAETGAPVIPVAQWGSLRFLNPLAKKRRFRFGFRRPVTVVAGEEVDLSEFAGKEHSSLTEITDRVMNAVRLQLAEIRGAEAPQLYEFHRRRSSAAPTETSESASSDNLPTENNEGDTNGEGTTNK